MGSTRPDRLCALTGHRLGRVPDGGGIGSISLAGVIEAHYNFTDWVSGERVYNWRCRCGLRFMASGRWSGFIVPRRMQQEG